MKNLYSGVNPHLNSRLQSPNGGWLSFLLHRMAEIAAENNNSDVTETR